MTHARSGQPVPRPPARPRWLNHVPYVLVLSGVAIGLAVVATGHFRRGSLLLGVAVLLGAVVRLILPESQVGLLAVRRRPVDVLILVMFALAIGAVAYVVQTD